MWLVTDTMIDENNFTVSDGYIALRVKSEPSRIANLLTEIREWDRQLTEAFAHFNRTIERVNDEDGA